MTEIFPSLISANLMNLEKEIEFLEPHCAGFHLDIMDFHFVENLTWGPKFINEIRKITKKTLQIHLMVEYPEKYFYRFKLNTNDIISVHIESPSAVPFEELLYIIKKINCIPSIAISPFTPLESIIRLQAPIEHILLMSVRPGFSGQEFLPHIINKLIALNNFRLAHNLKFQIAVDGGINKDNSKELIKNGANQLAVASAIFKYQDKIKAIESLVI